MKNKLILLILLIASGSLQSIAQSQKQMLFSKDAEVAKKKQLVYDCWRIVLEGGHLDKAADYLAESYIQHNPNVPTGRQGFIDFFSKFSKPVPICDTITEKLISIVAEKDLVVLSFKNELPDPKDATKKYTTTSFDMFRIENGKIAEHWDAERKE